MRLGVANAGGAVVSRESERTPGDAAVDGSDGLEQHPANPMPALLGHLSFGITALTVTAGVGAVAAARVATGEAALGFAAGCGIVWFFFSLSSFLIAWADMVNRDMIMPIGLGAYLGKICLVGFLVFAISDSDWAGFTGLVWGLIVGTAMWMAAQIGWGLWQNSRAEGPMMGAVDSDGWQGASHSEGDDK